MRPLSGRPSVKQTLDRLADEILELDPEELKALLPEIQARMDQADHTLEWERAVINFFIINAVRVKDKLCCQQQGRVFRSPGGARLRVVK